MQEIQTKFMANCAIYEAVGRLLVRKINSTEYDQSGWPDVCCVLSDGKTIWVEFKNGKEPIRSNQEIIIQRLASLGHEVYIIRTMEEMISLSQTIYRRMK